LADATLGVVGLGQIGSEIARRGLAFGMRVIAVDPVQTEAPAGVAALWKLDRMPQLLSESDFVAVAAPHTPETAKMFRRPEFQQMKRTGYFINIGRGATVDLTHVPRRDDDSSRAASNDRSRATSRLAVLSFRISSARLFARIRRSHAASSSEFAAGACGIARCASKSVC
jgi:hypothetical protein